jgi:hypothetical protein
LPRLGGLFTQFNSRHNTITHYTIINIGRHSIVIAAQNWIKIGLDKNITISDKCLNVETVIFFLYLVDPFQWIVSRECGILSGRQAYTVKTKGLLRDCRANLSIKAVRSLVRGSTKLGIYKELLAREICWV